MFESKALSYKLKDAQVLSFLKKKKHFKGWAPEISVEVDLSFVFVTEKTVANFSTVPPPAFSCSLHLSSLSPSPSPASSGWR